jgi:hypothetical protein
MSCWSSVGWRKSHVGSAATISTYHEQVSVPHCYSEFPTRVLLQVAIPTNQFLKQEAWLSEMLSRSRSYHLSRRSEVPGFDVLAQPLSARQKLDSFLLHRVFGPTHVDSAMCNKILTRPGSPVRNTTQIFHVYDVPGSLRSLYWLFIVVFMTSDLHPVHSKRYHHLKSFQHLSTCRQAI